MKTVHTVVPRKERAKPRKIKTDPVDWTVRTAYTLYSNRTVDDTIADHSVNIALSPDQHHISDMAKWR